MTVFFMIFRRFPTTFRRFPKTFEGDPKMFRWYTNESKYNLRDKRAITEIIDIFTCEDIDMWGYRSFSLSRSKNINRKPFSGLSQEIVILLKINKEDTSPSFRSVRYPKPQILGEMFRRNLQSSVWKCHVGAHLPSSCTAFSQAFAVNWFRWRISDERPGVAWTIT